MAANTLGEWSDGEDEFVWEFNEKDPWSDSEADDLIRNINEDEVLAGLYGNEDDDDELIRNINEDEVLAGLYGNDDDDDEALAEAVQTGRGEKRKSDDEEQALEGEYYYHIESVKKHHSKKFRMTATDHTVRFNNVLGEFDLLESHEKTQTIFEHLIADVTWDMNPKDHVRFVLRSEQLDAPISLPFLHVEQLTTERVFSQIERVIQSNQDFRLNDTVTIDIIHVEAPQGSGKSRIKRTTLNVREYLKKKKSIITINNTDNLCLARSLVVAVARIEKDPKYAQIRRSDKGHIQLQRALNLHQAANVPLGPCGLDEVKLFQQYLTKYQIIVVSGDHNDSIIYPPKPPGTAHKKQSINLYFHANHFDVITSIPGFLNKSYFCHRCHKTYSNTCDHLCQDMCRSCRAFGCVFEGNGIVCNECGRLFKNQACYDHHKEPINSGGRSVCQVIRKCKECGKAVAVNHMNGHVCGKKCRTCGVILKQEDDEHKCYIQQLEQEEESSYNHLLFFDFESTQEHVIHRPNLCVVHDEEREVGLFQGEDTVKEFCEWLLTPEHKGCIVVAHNFQGYDGYFITKFLVENAIHYEIIYRGAKSLSMTIPMFNIKFIDSLNFIPMSLAKFPKTFGQDELCKGYFPHLFNKDENQNYVGPIPCQNDYGVNFKKPEERKAFIAWHQEQVENDYLFDFRKEIIKYCRSDVDIMRKCCLLFREMLRDETDIDPFDKSLTIASYCHQVYRTNFLKKGTIAVFQPDRQLKIMQSNIAVKWLSYIMEEEDIHIQHVRNGGEKRVGRYSLDGYCQETHTAYEFQGFFWHGKGL